MFRVNAIRGNHRVGRGTCTMIDETYTDQELIDDLNSEKIYTAKAAIEWAVDLEGLWLEKGLNQRWGEDDDPQLIAWREWNES